MTKLKGIDRTSLVIDGLKAQAVSSVTNQTIDFDAAKTEVHLRQNGADLDGAITLNNAATVVQGWPQILPRLNAIADVTLAGKAGMIDGSDTTGLYGASGELRRVMLDIGEGRIMRISGPFALTIRVICRANSSWKSKSWATGPTMPSKPSRSFNRPSTPPASFSAHWLAAVIAHPSISWLIAAAPPSAASFHSAKFRRSDKPAEHDRLPSYRLMGAGQSVRFETHADRQMQQSLESIKPSETNPLRDCAAALHLTLMLFARFGRNSWRCG